MNEENLRQRIRVLLDEIQNEADPVMLNRYRSIFRREVSFFRRSYMAAYLLLLAEGALEDKAAPSPKKRFAKKEEGSFRFGRKKNSDDPRSESPHAEFSRALSDEESVQLFVSIGRNRKVFPREILSLVISKAKAAREDIGTIRILDNFSFVQVRSGIAESVIAALNGHHFRGRTLTVNYARTRREDEDETPQDKASAEGAGDTLG
jgi:hypothetical protein